MVERRILKPGGASEWASPAFIIPKRMVRFDKSLTYAHSTKLSFASNTHYPSSWTCQSKYPGTNSLPNSISPCYTTQAQKTNWYTIWQIQLQTSPYGTQMRPEFAQQVMKEVLHDVQDTGVYLNNIGAFSFTWENYMLLFDKILHRLKANGFNVNRLNANEPSIN